MHSNAMWPIHGRYICRVCLREYPISWFAEEEAIDGAEDHRSVASGLGGLPAGLQDSPRS